MNNNDCELDHCHSNDFCRLKLTAQPQHTKAPPPSSQSLALHCASGRQKLVAFTRTQRVRETVPDGESAVVAAARQGENTHLARLSRRSWIFHHALNRRFTRLLRSGPPPHALHRQKRCHGAQGDLAQACANSCADVAVHIETRADHGRIADSARHFERQTAGCARGGEPAAAVEDEHANETWVFERSSSDA